MTPTNLNASTRIMYETAQAMGIECQVVGDTEVVIMKHQGKQWYVRGSRTSLQSSVGKTIADRKEITKALLDLHQVPTAKSALVENESQLNKLQNLKFPMVMKPVAQRHGKGVVVGIKDLQQATELYQKQDYGEMLFEEMLQGTEYRIVCVDFKFVAAAFRKPAHVVGDGQHTITELIAEKNNHPWRGKGHHHNLTLIEVDQALSDNVAEQGLQLDSVPAANQEVWLRKTANLSTGGEAWDVTDQVSPENQELFETIAKACDLNVIGIDMMCQSLETPIVNQPQAGVIEVNASPGLRMHHYPIQGQARNVAQAILEMVLAHKGVTV